MSLNGAVFTWTGYSPTLGAGAANLAANTGVLQFGNSALVNTIENKIRRTQMRAFQKVLRALVGAAAGGAALATRSRVVAKQALNDPADIGGVVSIETVNLVNRVTTAADVTYIDSVLDKLTAPSPYAADTSGNGGGGKLGF